MSLQKERGPITRNFSFTCLLLCTAMTFYLLSYLGFQPSKTGKRSLQCPESLQDQTLESQVQAPSALQTAHRAHPTLQSNSNHRTKGLLLEKLAFLLILNLSFSKKHPSLSTVNLNLLNADRSSSGLRAEVAFPLTLWNRKNTKRQRTVTTSAREQDKVLYPCSLR